MSVGLLIIGFVGIAASALLTRNYWRRAGLHSYEARNASAGTGIVPSWVSLLNLASWLCLLLGVVMLLYGWLVG